MLEAGVGFSIADSGKMDRVKKIFWCDPFFNSWQIDSLPINKTILTKRIKNGHF
jgi:hypothetical protein